MGSTEDLLNQKAATWDASERVRNLQMAWEGFQAMPLWQTSHLGLPKNQPSTPKKYKLRIRLPLPVTDPLRPTHATEFHQRSPLPHNRLTPSLPSDSSLDRPIRRCEVAGTSLRRRALAMSCRKLGSEGSKPLSTSRWYLEGPSQAA